MLPRYSAFSSSGFEQRGLQREDSLRLFSLWVLRSSDSTNLHCCKIVSAPIFTNASSLTTHPSGVTGFVRSYGAHLPVEGITLNAICPNVVKTAISSSDFYDKCEAGNLLTPMQSLLDVFESLLGEDGRSGQIFEVGPHGMQTRDAPEPMDADTGILMDMLKERGKSLHLATN